MLFDLSMNPWRLSEEYPEEAQAETVYCTYTTAPASQCETDTASRGRSRTGRSERSREEQDREIREEQRGADIIRVLPPPHLSNTAEI